MDEVVSVVSKRGEGQSGQREAEQSCLLVNV